MDFQVNLNLLGWFLTCVLLESFIKFPVDPYYEPLLWFMIIITRIFKNLIFKKLSRNCLLLQSKETRNNVLT